MVFYLGWFCVLWLLRSLSYLLRALGVDIRSFFPTLVRYPSALVGKYRWGVEEATKLGRVRVVSCPFAVDVSPVCVGRYYLDWEQGYLIGAISRRVDAPYVHVLQGV